MKKMVSLFLALALAMSFAVMASAEDNVGTGAYSTEVTGAYVPGTTGGTVFSVDIAWSGMSFTYHAQQQPVWDAENHKYSAAAAAYWEGNGSITVTNHSNAKILATPVFTPAEGYNTAAMTFSATALKVASAAESGVAQSGTITVTPTGYLPEMESAATIGTITVTIAQDTDVTLEEATALVATIEAFVEESKTNGVYDAYTTELVSLCGDMDILKEAIDAFESDSTAENQAQLNKYYTYAINSYNNWKNLTV